MTKIIGIYLLKNEDVWIEQSIRNVAHFCDDIIVLDNGSTDGTNDIVQRMGLRIINEPDLRATHDYIQKYIGKDVWIQRVDGDEVYDPVGLIQLREDIFSGMYDNVFQVVPWFLHAIQFTPDYTNARGFLAPPSHPPCKLYNFKNLISWKNNRANHLFLEKPRVICDGVIEREEGFHRLSWDTAIYRCLHTRFFRRSTKELANVVGGKDNPAAVVGKRKSDYGDVPGYNQRLRYRIGAVVDCDVRAFQLNKFYCKKILGDKK